MSLTRSQLEYNKLPFREKIQFVLNLYNKRINQLNTFPAALFKEDYNVYISIVRSIRDYLATYLTKNSNENFEKILTDGYQKYDHYSPDDYIPTLELCKDDPLSLYDLDCAIKILKKSIFLSNNDFIKDIIQLTNGQYALTQYAINNNSPEIVDELKNDTFSNGFKYFLEGILFEQKNKWGTLFNNNTNVPEYVDLGVLMSGILTSGGTLLSLCQGGILPMVAFTITASSLAYVHGCLSDKIAVKFFSNKGRRPEVDANEIIQDVPTRKQNITPYRVGC